MHKKSFASSLFLASVFTLGSFPCLGFVHADSPVVSDTEKTETSPPPSPTPESTPSKPSRCTVYEGAVLYDELGSAMHRQRYQDELTPAEWLTTLMFHRIKIPLTAEEHCNLIKFFTDCSSAMDSVKQDNVKTPDDEVYNDINMKKTSSCQLGNFPTSNLLIKGSTFTGFKAPEDFNNTFSAGLNPLFLWRYKDKILFEMELEISLDGNSTNIDMEYTDINYIMNDYLTVRAGKFLLPLGFWKEKMHPEWINKFPNPPLPYQDEAHPVIPPADLGIDTRGAVSLGTFGGRLDAPMVLTYDFWTGNGPAEGDDGDIDITGTNYTDNNNNKAIGARLCFRPWPYREIAVSGYRGQWNNNKHGGDILTKHHLFYNALVGELDIHFDDYLRLCGEYMWTRRDTVVNPDLGIMSTKVYTRAWWAQLSYAMNVFHVKYIQNLEPLLRYGLISTDVEGANKRQWSFGLNYYLTNKCIFKIAYDINHGHQFHKNSLNLQWAYGY